MEVTGNQNFLQNIFFVFPQNKKSGLEQYEAKQMMTIFNFVELEQGTEPPLIPGRHIIMAARCSG